MRKPILALLALLMFSATAFAQLEKGTFLLGGGVGYNSSTSQTEDDVSSAESTLNSFNFSPDLGYFFADNWVAGLSIPLSWQKMETEYESNRNRSMSKSSSYGVAPFVRRYFPFGEKLSAYGQFSLGYRSQSSENTPDVSADNKSTSDSDSFFGTATLGLSYFPKRWMGINLSLSPLGFSNGSSQQEGFGSYSESDSSGFSFGVDISAIALGVNFFLVKK